MMEYSVVWRRMWDRDTREESEGRTGSHVRTAHFIMTVQINLCQVVLLFCLTL